MNQLKGAKYTDDADIERSHFSYIFKFDYIQLSIQLFISFLKTH